MHVDVNTPSSDLLGFSAIWSNSSTNIQFLTQQETGGNVTSSDVGYALAVKSTVMDIVVINGDETRKPLCMIGIPSDGTINTISVQATTAIPAPGPIGPVRSRMRTIESGKARSQLLKWLQRKMKRKQISGYNNRLKIKE